MGNTGVRNTRIIQRALGMGARGFLGIGALEFTRESLRGTVAVDSKRRDGGEAGSWIQFRWLL